MENASLQPDSRRKDWKLTAPAFHRLLTWLDEGADSTGQSYLELRQRLVRYFDRKNCPAPDDLADETLNRVARRLEEEGTIEIETPAKFCYIVARYVFMEDLRERQTNRVVNEGRDAEVRIASAPNADEERALREKTLECLEHCIAKLESSNRELILNYYVGKQQIKIENRRALAQRLGITINALSIRACRIREKLAGCVKQCMAVG